MTLPGTLPDVQAHVGAAVVRNDPIAADATLARRTEAIVAPGLRLSPVEQLDIYREQFWLRHVGALKEDFATIHHLLGDDDFQSLCAAYLAAHPPASFTLRDLGERMAGFVRTAQPWSNDRLIDDCARLEWAFVDAFDAPDAPPLDAASIAQAPEDAWPGARVVLDPSVQRVEMGYAAHVFRAEVKDGKEPPRPGPKPTCVVVYRGPDKLMYIEIEPLAFALLGKLAEGVPLAAACEAVASTAGVSEASELETKVGEWFQAWAAYGWVSRVEF